MASYIEGWRRHNPSSGLTSRSIGMRQSGINHLMYLVEHPKVAGLKFTYKGELNRRHHTVITRLRGRNPL